MNIKKKRKEMQSDSSDDSEMPDQGTSIDKQERLEDTRTNTPCSNISDDSKNSFRSSENNRSKKKKFNDQKKEKMIEKDTSNEKLNESEYNNSSEKIYQYFNTYSISGNTNETGSAESQKFSSYESKKTDSNFKSANTSEYRNKNLFIDSLDEILHGDQGLTENFKKDDKKNIYEIEDIEVIKKRRIENKKKFILNSKAKSCENFVEADIAEKIDQSSDFIKINRIKSVESKSANTETIIKKTSIEKIEVNNKIKLIAIDTKKKSVQESNKSQILRKLDTDINELKNEIKMAKMYECIPRPLLNFEKYINCTKNLFFNAVYHTKNIIKNKIDEYKKNIVEINDFYASAKHLPTLFILKNSKKNVSTDEWFYAKDEKKIIKRLEVFDSMKKKGKFDCFKHEKADGENLEYQKEIKKKLILEIKNHFENSLIFKDSEFEIHHRPEIFYLSVFKKEKKKEAKQTTAKRFTEIFDAIENTKPKVLQSSNLSKKGNANIHSSHLNTLSKILPEMSRLQTPLAIIEYRERMKNKNLQKNYFNNKEIGKGILIGKNFPYKK